MGIFELMRVKNEQTEQMYKNIEASKLKKNEVVEVLIGFADLERLFKANPELTSEKNYLYFKNCKEVKD